MNEAASGRVLSEKDTLDDKASTLITMLDNLVNLEAPAPPKGEFGRVCQVKTSAVSIDSENLDMEFTIPFDDEMEANEAQITIYNLSDSTIANLKYNTPISVTAGYRGDTGVVFTGFISKVTTKVDGVDKKTTIYALDDMDLQEHAIESISFKENTPAIYILQQLISLIKLPVAVFKPRRDWIYKDKVTVDGKIMENIKKYAEVCGISVYINKGRIYARYIKDGDNIHFTVSEETGMIGSPEEFEEEVTAEDYKDVVKGYKVKMLLQHRMTTGAIINLKSQSANGTFRVRSGQHSFSDSDALTEIEVIE